jgi:hypothetical protein
MINLVSVMTIRISAHWLDWTRWVVVGAAGWLRMQSQNRSSSFGLIGRSVIEKQR